MISQSSDELVSVITSSVGVILGLTLYGTRHIVRCLDGADNVMVVTN